MFPLSDLICLHIVKLFRCEEGCYLYSHIFSQQGLKVLMHPIFCCCNFCWWI